MSPQRDVRRAVHVPGADLGPVLDGDEDAVPPAAESDAPAVRSDVEDQVMAQIARDFPEMPYAESPPPYGGDPRRAVGLGERCHVADTCHARW